MPTYRGNGGCLRIGGNGVPTYRGNRGRLRIGGRGGCLRIVGIPFPPIRRHPYSSYYVGPPPHSPYKGEMGCLRIGGIGGVPTYRGNLGAYV